MRRIGQRALPAVVTSGQRFHFLFVGVDVELAGYGGVDEGGAEFAEAINSGRYVFDGVFDLDRFVRNIPADLRLVFEIGEETPDLPE